MHSDRAKEAAATPAQLSPDVAQDVAPEAQRAPEVQPAPDQAPKSPPAEQALEETAPAKAPVASDEDEGEIDAVLLAQEFSRLLQESAEGDET
jgi:hypothetical protein